VAFKVDCAREINWQEDAFSNLVLPAAQKSLIQALVQSHSSGDEKSNFDDFIQGKGKGLIINLFGPPGVGKTLSAEATSEYVKRPLYVVGVGELGSNVESRLKEIFDVAAIWQAIVLIDEADVFMEQRSVSDLDRNALVAIFLRQLEYYRGILFLTTNRVKVFDEAFQSRIHISLHYQDLTSAAKRQIWNAFFLKAGMDIKKLSQAEWDHLSNAKVNGRQIKNAVRSCQGLATSRNEPLSFKHIQEVLGVMKQFETDLKALKESNDLM
jgi:SpoVK/Ycf46/Vps4 family AAA+-type ATPase